MARRWIVVVPVLGLVFGVLLALATNRGANYTMRGSYVLVAAETVNPASSQLNPQVATDALDDLLLQPSVFQQIASEGLSTDYSVEVGIFGTSVRLSVTGASTDIVTNTATRLVELAPELLEQTLGTEGGSSFSARALSVLGAENVLSADGEFSLSTSIVVSVDPANSTNPFPATFVTVQSLIALVNSVEFEDRVAETAGSAKYTVTNTVREGPIVDITVTAPSASSAVAGYEVVRDELREGLLRLQDESEVAPGYRTVIRTIVEPQAPARTPSSLVRPAVGVVILGVGLAAGLAILAESTSVGRRRRGRAARRPPDESATGPDGKYVETAQPHSAALADRQVPADHTAADRPSETVSLDADEVHSNARDVDSDHAVKVRMNDATIGARKGDDGDAGVTSRRVPQRRSRSR